MSGVRGVRQEVEECGWHGKMKRQTRGPDVGV